MTPQRRAPAGHALLLNAGFDLTLAGRELDLRERRRVRLLSLCALIGCGADDVALLEATPDAAFLDYLVDAGLPRPRWCELPDVAADARLLPLGFDRHARALLARHSPAPPELPTLQTLARVNARSYGAALEAELFGPEVAGRVAHTLDEARQHVAELGERVVLKRERSSAGLGNHRVSPGATLDTDGRALAFARAALEADAVLVVERWRRRLVDASVVFEVDRQGSASRLTTHETMQTDGGGHIGALLGAPPPLLAAELVALQQTAQTVSARLAADGYWGPVCLDAFVFVADDGARSLRALVEINARRPVSFAAARLRERDFADRAMLARFVSRRRLVVEPSYRAIVAALGDAAYDPPERCGVLVASPLFAQLDGAAVTPQKIAFIVVARDAEAVRELERRLRARVAG